MTSKKRKASGFGFVQVPRISLNCAAIANAQKAMFILPPEYLASRWDLSHTRRATKTVSTIILQRSCSATDKDR